MKGPYPKRRASDHPEVVAAVEHANGKSGGSHRKTAVIIAVCVALLIVGVFFWRAIANERRDIELCHDMDRFALAILMSVEADPEQTEAEKKAAGVFIRNFREDLDCPTALAHHSEDQ